MMLDRLVIHLKNIIFFKLVVSTICIILLLALIPEFQKDLSKSLKRKEKAEILLNNANTQLKSASEFEKNIYETDVKYKELIQNSDQKSCATRTEFLKNLYLISNKHRLREPIKTKLKRIFENTPIENKSSEVKLHQYTALINFSVNSSNDVLSLIDEIYSVLPQGSTIVSTQVKILQVLSPDIIKELSTDEYPSLIDVSIKILLKEIVYEK